MPTGGANEEWWTGPPGARRSYRVVEPTPLPGGQGYVFRAIGPDGADVALKIAEAATEAEEAKLRQRCQALAEHPHPRIAANLRVFRGPGLFRGDPPPEDECDLFVIVSPWVEGWSLRALGARPPAEALQIVADVAEAVQHLHDACGFVHRDLHPGNVIVGTDGRATVIDLGAAREEDGGHTTTVAGVLGFIAPERTHGPGDKRTDRWGVGMIAVFALLGRPRGDRSTEDLRADLRRALAGTARPARAAALVTAMVDPDPAKRPEDLAAWVRDLRAAMAPAGTNARRRRAVVAAVALALAAGGVALVLDDDDEQRTAASEGSAAASSEPCGADFGEPGPDVDANKAGSVAPLFRSAAGGGCASGPVEAVGEALVQPVAGEDGPGFVVVGPRRTAVRLSQAQWQSYLSLGGASTFAGVPVAVLEVPGGRAVELSGSGYLVGRRPDSYHGWIPEQAYEVWTANGGGAGAVGFPMTGPYFFEGGIRHDFERGYFEVAAENYPYNALDPGVIEVNVVSEDERTDRLGDPDALIGRIVHSANGPSWYVDERRLRRWVPDEATLECLGGQENVAREDVPGWALATLALGPVATCG